jgi:rsbT antagonist protein RsbS
MREGTIPRVPLQVSRNCLVASIQVDLTEEVLKQFQDDLLSLLWSSGVSTVILDVSGVEIMDPEDFNSLVHAMNMADLMGARPVLAGLRPGVVASLIDLDVEVGRIEAALNLDHAYSLVNIRSAETDVVEEEAAAEDDTDPTVERDGNDEEVSHNDTCDLGA